MVVNEKQTNNKFYPILTLKRSFAAAIKWFAFRYLNIVKGVYHYVGICDNN